MVGIEREKDKEASSTMHTVGAQLMPDPSSSMVCMEAWSPASLITFKRLDPVYLHWFGYNLLLIILLLTMM